MNIPYLLKTIGTVKLSELVAVIDAPPIDLNLAIWDSIDNGEIEVDEDKDRVKLTAKDAQPWHNPDLATKIIRVAQHYAANEVNINKGRLDAYIRDPKTGAGEPMHEYLMTLQYLIDTGQLVQEIVSLPKTPKRPYHKFLFLCLPENAEVNQEWNAKQINSWIARFESNKVK